MIQLEKKIKDKRYTQDIFISLNFDIYNDTALSNMNTVTSVDDDIAEIERGEFMSHQNKVCNSGGKQQKDNCSNDVETLFLHLLVQPLSITIPILSTTLIMAVDHRR